MNSYADGITHFSNGTNVVLSDMENKTYNVFDWFSKNYLKANSGKSNLLFTSTEKNFYENWRLYLRKSTFKKLLGVIIGIELNFVEHVPE